MFRLLGALLDVFASRIGQLGIPDEVLGAVKTAPVPVGAHDGTDEVGIVLVRGVVVDEITQPDLVGGGCYRHGSREGEESSYDLHDVGQSSVSWSEPRVEGRT